MKKQLKNECEKAGGEKTDFKILQAYIYLSLLL